MPSPRGPYTRHAQIKAYVPEALKEALREYVQEDYGRSESTVVMEALREWLPKHGKVLRLKGSDDQMPHEEESPGDHPAKNPPYLDLGCRAIPVRRELAKQLA